MMRNISERPRIRVEPSPTDRTVEFICGALLAALWIGTWVAYNRLPEIIPQHFNGRGQPDDYGSRSFLFVLPALATVLYAGLTVLNRYPHIFNYLVPITEGNALHQYTLATRMIRWLKLVILLIFSLVVWEVYRQGSGSRGLGMALVPVCIVLPLLPTVVFLLKAARPEPGKQA